MSFFFMLAAALPWILVIVAMVWFANRIQPSRDQRLDAEDLRELREQVTLTRDFLRDASERIRRLEAAVGPERLGPGRGTTGTAPGEPDPLGLGGGEEGAAGGPSGPRSPGDAAPPGERSGAEGTD